MRVLTVTAVPMTSTHVSARRGPGSVKADASRSYQGSGELMMSYGCGVRNAETIVIKEIDEDFFDLT